MASSTAKKPAIAKKAKTTTKKPTTNSTSAKNDHEQRVVAEEADVLIQGRTSRSRHRPRLFRGSGQRGRRRRIEADPAVDVAEVIRHAGRSPNMSDPDTSPASLDGVPGAVVSRP